ncbi:MAG: rhodanese-like domain-containing protein [Bacteroidales bacterium]
MFILKLINRNNRIAKLIIAGLAAMVLISCSQTSEEVSFDKPSVENTMLLLDWIEQTGDYTNSSEFPSILDAAEVYAWRDENILLIDLRPYEHYRAGHIEHAINLRPGEVMHFFRNKIDPPAFKSIIFTCNTGMLSSYVTSVLRNLGYNNTFAMRYGMSGWDRSIAEQYWLANTGDQFEGKLEQTNNPMMQAGLLPAIENKGNDGFMLAVSQAEKVLSESPDEFMISIDELSKDLVKYYIVCYWSDDKCSEAGHLPGAVRYEPKRSLTRDSFLNTLPTDRPIVIYCNSAHQSSFVTAYLRMLGYDARSLIYGANGFIYKTMMRLEPNPRRTFKEGFIQNLPLVTEKNRQPEPESKDIEIEKTTIQGGC